MRERTTAKGGQPRSNVAGRAAQPTTPTAELRAAVKAGHETLKSWLVRHQGTNTYLEALGFLCLGTAWSESDAVTATRALLRAGLDPNALFKAPNPGRMSIIHTFGQLALARPPVLKVLLDAGALQVNQRQPPENSTLLHKCVQLWQCCHKGTSQPGIKLPPPKAAVSSCQLLLKAGADPAMGDQVSATACFYALRTASDTGDVSLVEALQSCSPKPVGAGRGQAGQGGLSLAAALKLSQPKLVQGIREACDRLGRLPGSSSSSSAGAPGSGAGAVDSMSVRQLKAALQERGVDCSACVEKGELTCLLMQSLPSPSPSAGPGPGEVPQSPASTAAAGGSKEAELEASLHADLTTLLLVAIEKLESWDEAIEHLLPATAFLPQLLYVELVAQNLALRAVTGDDSWHRSMSHGMGALVHHGAQDMPVSPGNLDRFLSHFRCHPTHLGLFSFLRWNTFLKRAVCTDPALTALLPLGLETYLGWARADPGGFRRLDPGQQEQVAYCSVAAVSWVAQVHDLLDVSDQPELFEAAFVKCSRTKPFHLLLVAALELGFSSVVPGLFGLGHFPGVAAEALAEMGRRPACFQHLGAWVQHLVAALQSGRLDRLDGPKDEFVQEALHFLLCAVTSPPPAAAAGAQPAEGFREALDALLGSALWPAVQRLAALDVEGVVAKILQQPQLRATAIIYATAVAEAAALRAAADPASAAYFPAAAVHVLLLQRGGGGRGGSCATLEIPTFTHPLPSPAAANIELVGQRFRWLRVNVLSEASSGSSSGGGGGGGGGGTQGVVVPPMIAALRASQALADNRRLSHGIENCWQCSATAQQAGIDKMLVCAQCRDARYCSKECQKQHWKQGHKILCDKRDSRIDLTHRATGATLIVPGANNFEKHRMDIRAGTLPDAKQEHEAK